MAGMKWLLGVYTKRFNIRHKQCGHLFAGRYKSLLVDGSGDGYLRTVCDYVHLNPVRAKLVPPKAPLSGFRWSSYGDYLKAAAQRPVWLRVDRLLGEKGIWLIKMLIFPIAPQIVPRAVKNGSECVRLRDLREIALSC